MRFLESACRSMENFLRRGSGEAPFEAETLGSIESQVLSQIENFEELKEGTEIGFFDELEKANQAAATQANLVEAYGNIMTETSSEIKRILEKYGEDQKKLRFDEIGDMLSRNGE